MVGAIVMEQPRKPNPKQRDRLAKPITPIARLRALQVRRQSGEAIPAMVRTSIATMTALAVSSPR